MEFRNEKIGQLFELLNERITALDESIQSKEKGAYVHYECADMPGNFLRMIPHTNEIKVEMGIPRETIQDSHGLCKLCGHSGWDSAITVLPESDIDYIMGLVIQGYEHYLRKEEKTMSDELKPALKISVHKTSESCIVEISNGSGNVLASNNEPGIFYGIDIRFSDDRVWVEFAKPENTGDLK